VQRFAFREFSQEPALKFDEFQRRLGRHFSNSSPEAANDLLEFQRIWFHESDWYWPSPLLDPEFFRHRARRLKWPQEKLVEYERNLTRLKTMSARYVDSTSAAEREMARLAALVVERWGSSTPRTLE
jgi:hypothetical protein